MTNLSPAAQAVMDACTDAPIQINWATKLAAAAALRAAADQVEQKLRGFSREACQEIRAIAAELESNAQSVAEGVLPLKERPDFIAGYREGLADRRRIIECEEAERQHPQPVAEGPTDEEIEEWADACSEAPLEEMDPEVHGWRRCFTAKEFSETIRAALDRWGNSQGILDSLPQPEGADIHYAWELHDAEGEWQCGGSADSLEDVQREGSRYLQTYAQDGPHKLIIQRHCVTTIEEAANAQ